MSDRVETLPAQAGALSAPRRDEPRHGSAVSGHTRRRYLKFVPLVVVAGGLLGAYLFGLHDYLSLDALARQREALLAAVAENRISAALIYVGLYALAVAFAFPAASVLTIIGGFLFGWLAGGLLTALAATLGATALFLAARTALSDTLQQKAGPRLQRLRDGFNQDAFSYLLALRLAPVFPFFVVNIAPAVFGVRLRIFVAATALGILPGTFAYAYLGEGLDSALLAAAEAGRSLSIGDLATPQLTIALAALACIATIPVIIRKLNR
jgi:uncharacterized membrane protein YdjX (TVP38/TMEM64 family)